MEKKSFLFLTTLTFFSQALISIIMPMASEVALALNLGSDVKVEFINSMFLMVGACSSLVWAILADKFPRKKLLIIATFEWAIFTFLTIFAFDFYSLLIIQLITAVGFGSALPLTFSLVVDLFEVGSRGKAFGTLSAIYVLGNGLGHMLSGFLIDYFSWIVPFIILSIGGFACGISLLFFKEPVRGGMDGIAGLSDASVLGLSYKIDLKDLKYIWQIKSNFWIIILNFAMFIAIGAISSNFITMLKNDYGFSSTIATYLLIIIFGSQMISGPVIGSIADKQYQKNKTGRIKVVLVCLILGPIFYIVGYSLIFTSDDLGMVLIFIILIFIGAFFFGGIDPLTQATLGEVSPLKIRSTAFSLNYLSYTFGRSLSILLAGSLKLAFNDLYRPGYVILSILALTCAIFLLPLLKTLDRDLWKAKTVEIGKKKEKTMIF
jgi:MFS family permease